MTSQNEVQFAYIYNKQTLQLLYLQILEPGTRNSHITHTTQKPCASKEKQNNISKEKGPIYQSYSLLLQ